MLDNHAYNLFAQLTEESKSLWRINNNYLTDATNCDQCRIFWQRIIQEKEDNIAGLRQLIKSHLD